MSVRERVARYRKQKRAQGLRAIKVWVPDVHEPEFADEVRRQAALVDASYRRDDVMDWAESVSVDWDEPASS